MKEIRSWYDEINPEVTVRFKTVFFRTEKDILTNPLAFAKTDYRDFRRAVVKKFPYKIVYRIEGNRIQVFGVIHFRRSKSYLKRRLRK